MKTVVATLNRIPDCLMFFFSRLLKIYRVATVTFSMFIPFNQRVLNFGSKNIFKMAVTVHPDDRSRTDFDLKSLITHKVRYGARGISGYSKYGLLEQRDEMRDKLHIRR